MVVGPRHGCWATDRCPAGFAKSRSAARNRPVPWTDARTGHCGGRTPGSGRSKSEHNFSTTGCVDYNPVLGMLSHALGWPSRAPSPARASVSQPPEPKPPTFSHDLTLKSVFAEPDVAADLIAFLVQYRCPELRGWAPVQVVAGSSVTTDPKAPPHQSEGHRDLVWLLARGDRSRERMLLHLEFQSQHDRDMSGRMFAYALATPPACATWRICGLVVNTGLRPLDRGGCRCSVWRGRTGTGSGRACCWTSTPFGCRVCREGSIRCRWAIWCRASWPWRGCRPR